MKTSFLIVFTFILSSVVFAQNTDADLWTGLGMKYKLSKKVQLGAEQQFRFNDGMTTFDRTFTEVLVKWRFAKRFSLRPNYRYTMQPNDLNSHRLSGDLIYHSKKKKKTIRVKNRFRYQRKIEAQTRNTTTYLRNKLTIGVNASKVVDPYFFGELFYRLDGRNEFRAWRSGVGLDWKISKELGLSTFYIFEGELNRNVNDNVHIVGVLLDWNLK